MMNLTSILMYRLINATDGKTKIYKSYAHFLRRKDKTVNGVSPEFAAANPNFKQENISNLGCWNCTKCTACVDCVNCVNNVVGFQNVNCDYCDSCVQCKNCQCLNGEKKQVVEINKTEIFATKEAFDRRKDKTVNGVSPKFAAENIYWVQENTTNVGCWNCVNCSHCTDCIDCQNLSQCFRSWSCEYGTHLKDCYACSQCHYCELCENCLNCDGCSQCEYCFNGRGLFTNKDL